MNRILLILLCALLVAASCARKQPGDTRLNIGVTPDKEGVLKQDLTAQEIRIMPSQVIYHPRFKPEPLTNEQSAILSRRIDSTKLDRKEVWFVRVLYNRNKDLTAKIYFMPEATSDRTRKGKYIYHRLVDFESVGKLTEEAPTPEYFEYYQVSPKQNTFGAEAAIPPQNSMLPFAAPEGFSEQEVVKIVDFVRSAPKVKLKTRPGLIYLQIRQNLPIMTIKRQGQIIEVKTGTQEGGLSGRGQFLEIQKTHEGYELIGVQEWVS